MRTRLSNCPCGRDTVHQSLAVISFSSLYFILLFFFFLNPRPRLSSQQTGVFTRLVSGWSIYRYYLFVLTVCPCRVWFVYRSSAKTTNNAAWRTRSEGWTIRAADTLPSALSNAKRRYQRKRPHCSFPFVEAPSPSPVCPLFPVNFCYLLLSTNNSNPRDRSRTATLLGLVLLQVGVRACAFDPTHPIPRNHLRSRSKC